MDARPTVLIVDDDPATCAALAARLAEDGLVSESVHDGVTAVQRAIALRPQLVVLDLALPELSGDQVFDRLQADHRTRYTPVVFLTGSAQRDEKVRRLRAGADDYVTKPFDLEELAARVQTALRRSRTLGGLNPLSGLPGNTAIYEEITARLRAPERFACLYLDIDNFKSFNDRYGFTRGDTLIVELAEAIFGAVEASGQDAFLGHIGGDDFVVICAVDESESLAEEIVTRFGVRSRQLHDAGDIAAGGYEAPDRRGLRSRWPFASVSVGIALSDSRAFPTAAALAQAAAEMKTVAKRQRGGRVAVDRRQARAASRSQDDLHRS
ncbi:MAG TPA: response regulator [Candidatus Limnocylindria bacterium]|nr:response regulator [Candidatus Limnocylindria bacterium]